MTSNERARMAYSILKEAADNIDDPDDNSELDDILFKIQSDLKYRTREIIECYEILDDELYID